MFWRTILLTFRNLRRNLLYTLIVIGGLSLGISTFISIIQWTAWHISFDRANPNGNNIYRLSLIEHRDDFERHTARIIHGDIVRQLHNDVQIPGIQLIGRLSPYRNAIVRKEEIVFYEEKAFECDPEFLDLFNLKMKIGDPASVLDSPKKVILSENTAKKYFGDENPVGKLLEIVHQFDVKPGKYEITGVFENIPSNTHFKIDLLTSFSDPETFDGTAWVYLELKKNPNLSEIESLLDEFIVENNEEDYSKGIQSSIIPVFDIHLKSHLPRELEQNVQQQTILIIFIAGMLVFLLAWFNFTLLTISQNQLNLKKLIYQWQLGSGKEVFLKQFFLEFFIIGFISFIIAIAISLLISQPLSNNFGVPITQNTWLLGISLFIVLLILFISSVVTSLFATQRIYRTLKQKYFSNKTRPYSPVTSRNWFVRSVIIMEFIITIILVSNLLMIRAQVNYSMSKQIGSNDSSTIQIPNLPRTIINKYSTIKEELLKYPAFEEITALMEEPGGMAMDAFGFRLEGMPETENRLFVFPVDEDFIRFYNLKILAGRDFPSNFNLKDTSEYFVLNETAAKMFDVTSYDELLERKLSLNFEAKGVLYPGRVIGVIEDFHLSDMETKINPMIIFPEYYWLYCISIRLNGDHQAALTSLRTTWKDFFPDYPLRYYFTSELYENLYKTELTEIKILIIFSILSLLIAGTGLFALSGFFMQQKLHAAAIKKINGARIVHILKPELVQYLYLALFSSALGIPLAWLSINKWLKNFAFQTEIAIWIFPVIGVSLIVFSWAAVLYHVYKLARINPTNFIRGE